MNTAAYAECLIKQPTEYFTAFSVDSDLDMQGLQHKCREGCSKGNQGRSHHKPESISRAFEMGHTDGGMHALLL